MKPLKKAQYISNWIKGYAEMMPSKAQSLIIGISGGIDSSLISLFLQNKKRHKLNICLIHKNKDVPAYNVLNGKFKNFIDYKKLKIFFIKPSDYFNNLRKTYKKYLSPLSSHDLQEKI